ncbi:hypothetical protein BDZ89DRAFT_629233 [Hymenopellis radicata]|nr:hypothetical protein BDZ89DRAFT_629233 [Hymenopellis radicata]
MHSPYPPPQESILLPLDGSRHDCSAAATTIKAVLIAQTHHVAISISLLCPFTSLKHLAFEMYDQGPGRSVSLWCPGSALKSLMLDCRRWRCDTSDTFRAVLGDPCLFNLDALRRSTVHVHRIGEVGAWRKLLEKAREILEVFTLTVEYDVLEMEKALIHVRNGQHVVWDIRSSF